MKALSHGKMSCLALFLCTSLLSACGDSGSGSPSTNTGETTGATTGQNNGNADTGTAGGTDNTNETTSATGGTAGSQAPQTDTNGTDGGTSSEASDTGTTNQQNNQTDTTPAQPPITVAPINSGNDVSGGEDDSPTATETASLVGPFIKDTNRSAGPPSVPEGLTLLMSGENFLEFSWKPSTDDQSVEGYEIYRDGVLVYTIRGDTNFEFDYRSWITTSYIDCNYTRYTFCDDNPIVPGSSYEYRVAAIDNEGMKSAQSEPAVFQLAQRQSSGVDLSGYVQVFNEEFDGDSLNRDLWKTALPWGPNKVINSERQYFVNIFGSEPFPVDPFVFTGSTLRITGSVTPPELLDRANQQPYLSGVITTKDYFKMTYGYIEMSAKLTGGEGFLSTFYMFNQDFEKNKPEIDIAEYIGGRPDKLYQTYHYYDSNRARWSDGERHSTPTMESQLGSNLSEDFHTYSVLWEPGLVVWYLDGSEVRRLTGVRVSDEPMNIIAQLVVGSEWIGEPDTSALPKTFEIDYIKAWQKQ